MALLFTDYTDNVVADSDYKVTGDGMFDDLMESFTVHVDSQFCNSRLSGDQYAQVYLGGLQEVMKTSAKIFLEKDIADKQQELIDAQILLVEQQVLESVAKTELLEAQALTEAAKLLLVEAQTLGFQIDAKQKLYAKTMETFAVYESVNKVGSLPPAIENANMTTLFNDLNDLIEPGVTPIS